MNKRKMNEHLRLRAGLDKDLLDRGWHSRSYRRHFEDYTEYETINKKGKTVIKRVYTGDYRRQDLPDGKRAALRAIYIVLWLSMAALFALCATRQVEANMTWYVVVAQLGVLMGLAWTLGALLCYLTAPRDLTVGEWKSGSVSLRRGSVCTALALELTALTTGLHLLLHGENWGVKLLCVLGYFLAGGMAVFMNRLEANVPYQVFPSKETAPEDGTNIDV